MENQKEGKFQSGNVILVTLAHLVHDIYSAFLAPILPLLIEKLSLSYSLASLLTVAQRLPSLANPLIGIIADKTSVRYLVITSPSLTAITMSLLGLAPTFTVLLILCTVMGFSSALFHVPSPVLVRQISGNRIGKGMSYYMLGGELARSLGPLTIMGAVSLWGLEGTYKLIPFGLLASGILYFKLKKIKVEEKKVEREKKKNAKETFREYLPLFSTIMGLVFFRSIMKGSLTTFLPTYLTEQGESLWLAGISLSILQFAGAGGTLFAGTISDRLGRRRTLLITWIILPVILWGFISLQGILTFPLLIILGFFLFATDPILLAVANEIKSDRPAFINGIYMALNFVMSAFAILVVGIIGDNFGLAVTYNIASFAALLVIPFVFLLPKDR